MNTHNAIDPEMLVQRFLDQDLTAEERLQFVARLGRDEALRQRTIALEQLVLEAGRLPRPIVPDRFVERVLEKVEDSNQVGWTWTRFLRAPHVLHWNVAQAAAAACVLAIAVAGALSWTPRADRGAAVAATADLPRDAVLVRLVVLQEGARTVQAAGDFNGWNPDRTPLEQVSDGAWVTTIALTPGRYEYMFVVDGQRWIVDPFAAEQSDDGFGARNAVLEVRPLAVSDGQGPAESAL
jgi:hypothetical protein